MIQAVGKHLTEKILPFWMGLRDVRNGGWFGRMDDELHVYEDAPKGCILNSRILWTFATAARVTGSEVYKAYALSALEQLARFEDAENGGVFWSVTAEGKPDDLTKHTYCQAFAIYGLAAWVRLTGDEAALAKAMKLFEVIEHRCSDEGGYGEAYNADFSPQSNEKLSENNIVAVRTMNTLLHVLEAYAELYRACADEAVRRAGVVCLERFINVMYSAEKHRLEVFYDKDYNSMVDYQSYGHDIEGSWLIWDAAKTLLPEEERAPYMAMCLELADSVYSRAFTSRGVHNELIEGELHRERVWWVQAEAVLGFTNAYELTGDEKYAEAAAAVWAFILGNVVDKRPGSEWLWYCDENGNRIPGKDMAGEWKCPYHNGRMCLRLMEMEDAKA